MALIIPKMVVLKNDCLTWFFYLLFTCTGALMILWFVLSGSYQTILSIEEDIHLNMWVNTPSDEALDALMNGRGANVCTNPRDYDYWYDENWKYDGGECVRVTRACNRQVEQCLNTADTFFKESPTQSFIASFVQLDRVFPTGASMRQGVYYLPQIEAFAVSFEYFFTAPVVNLFSQSAGVTKPAKKDEVRLKSSEEVLTVFMDSNRDIRRIVSPGDSLHVPVTEMLDLAGYVDVLYTPNPTWGANAFHNATYPAGPIGLIGGIPIEMYVHCHKSPKMDLGKFDPEWRNYHGPTCYVIFNGQEVWSTRYDNQHLSLSEGKFAIAQSGIRITARMDGTWEVFNFNNCLLNFAALLVLLRAPKAIVTLLAVRGLGHLSTIYRRVVYDHFYVAEQIAGMTARIVSLGASFRELENTDDAGGMSRSSFRETICHVARFRMGDNVMDRKSSRVSSRASSRGSRYERQNSNGSKKKARCATEDIKMFADFAFQAILSGKKGNTVTGVFGRILRCLERSRFFQFFENVLLAMGFEELTDRQDDEDKSTTDRRISVDHYLSAASAAEPVGFEDLIWLFNKRRRIGFLERLFTPKHLTQFMEEARAKADDPFNSEGSVQEPETDNHPFSEALNGIEEQLSDIKVSNRSILRDNSEANRAIVSELYKKHELLKLELQTVKDDHDKVYYLESQLQETINQMKESKKVVEKLEKDKYDSALPLVNGQWSYAAVDQSKADKANVNGNRPAGGPLFGTSNGVTAHAPPGTPQLPMSPTLPTSRGSALTHRRSNESASASSALSMRQETSPLQVQNLLKLEQSVQALISTLQASSNIDYEMRSKSEIDMLALQAKAIEFDHQARELGIQVARRVRERMEDPGSPAAPRLPIS